LARPRTALRLGAQILAQRAHPRLRVQRLALDRDTADLALAKALDAIAVDVQLVAVGAQLHLHVAHVLLTAPQQAPAVALHARLSRQRLLELAREHLHRDPKIRSVRAQARRGEVEGL